MLREIQAKTLVASVRWEGSWFGLRYNMNLYRGCQHRCIYCDSRSECYGIERFDDEVLVKANAIDLLRRELPAKRSKGIISTGSMNDPYMPAEAELGLTRRALEVIAEHGFGVHIITKSALITRDLDLLERVNRVHASVFMTVTTADDALGKQLEPGASLVSERFAAVQALAARGIPTGITLMPVLPYIEDTEENLTAIVERAQAAGARYVILGLGMTLRNRQRAYYYAQLDRLFPGLRQRYEQRYGDRYSCQVPEAKRLARLVDALCQRYGLLQEAKPLAPRVLQPSLL